MSFVGSVGVLMANSGLDEILKSAFGGVEHMLSGKKFPQNVRALHLVMVHKVDKVDKVHKVHKVFIASIQNMDNGRGLVQSD